MLGTLGCARPGWREVEGCYVEYRGTPGVAIHAGPAPLTAPSASVDGRVVVTVRVGVPDGAPVRDADVVLTADTLGRATNAPLRRSATDAEGTVAWDTLPAGVYGLVVRRVGYDPVRHAVRVRAGAADSIEVRLREVSGC